MDINGNLKIIKMNKYKQYLDNSEYEFIPYSKEEYANGGLVYDNPNAAIEKQEVVQYPNGLTAQANHGTHESGNDAEVNLPNGTRIFSDRLKDPTTKKTFAKMAEKYKIKDIDSKSTDLKKSTKNASSLAKDKSKIESNQRDNKAKIASLKSEVDNQNKTLEFVKQKTGTVDQMEMLKKEISKQEDAVKKATKKYESAVSDDSNYSKDLDKVNNKINDNITEQSKIKSEIENVQKNIAELQGKLNAL